MSSKPICRLCFNEMHTCTDLQNYIEIYGDVGRLYECEKKIKSFLYLDISESDEYEKKLCLICLQHLETFYKFYEKVNEIQKKYLKEERYNTLVLQGILSQQEPDATKQTVIEDIVVNEVLGADLVELKPEHLVLDDIIKEEAVEPEQNIEAEEYVTNPKRRKTRSKAKIKKSLELEDPEREGESGNEFPARDSDNDDWPAQAILDKFPQTIIRNGLLAFKGKKLMAMISKFYKLECDLCPTDRPRFKLLKQLFSHYYEAHREQGYVTCCQTKFTRYPSIIMHMARHLQPDAFKCDICGYMVTRPRFLDSHKQTHLPESEKPFGCDQCSRRFCWKGALQIHQISHQPEGERKLFICHVCGKIYDTPGGLSMHKKHNHSEKIKTEESHVCHACAKSFATRTNLKEHMSIHEPREKDQVQCTECGKWLMNNRCLKSHMILHSTVMHNCNMCEYKTKKKFLLQRHLVTQHSSEKPFDCTTCGKKFKLKRALTVHLAQHTAQAKTYKCQFCDREFAFSTNFYTHRKIKHPVELQQMKQREVEEKRKRRIAAGIELDSQLEEEHDDFNEFIETDEMDLELIKHEM